MTVEENLAIARRAVEIYNAPAPDEFAEIAHPDIVWRPAMGRLEGTEYHGLEGLREGRDFLDAGFQEVRFETESLHAVGSKTVLVAGWLHGTGASSGAAVSAERGVVMRFRDGKIAWIASFPSIEEAERVAAEGTA